MMEVITYFSLTLLAWVGLPMLFIWMQNTWNIFTE